MELDEILMVVFTGVVAISTVTYAILTSQMVSEMRKMRYEERGRNPIFKTMHYRPPPNVVVKLAKRMWKAVRERGH